jgi:hypothetical protein
MKKLLVAESQLDTEDTTNIQLFLSSYYAYGLLDFDTEKIANEVCRVFKLKLSEYSFPFVILENEHGQQLTLKSVEDSY